MSKLKEIDTASNGQTKKKATPEEGEGGLI
jgi:hypothetical protein